VLRAHSAVLPSLLVHLPHNRSPPVIRFVADCSDWPARKLQWTDLHGVLVVGATACDRTTRSDIANPAILIPNSLSPGCLKPAVADSRLSLVPMRRESIVGTDCTEWTFPGDQLTLPDSSRGRTNDAPEAGNVLPHRSELQMNSIRVAGSRKPEIEATVRIGTALAIPDVLRSLGADPVTVLARAGWSLDWFDDPDRLVSFASRSRLVSACMAATKCPHFGLLVGQRTRLSSLGLVGALVKYEADLGTSLRSLVRYFHLHARGGLPTLVVQGNRAMLGYASYVPQVEAVDQLGDAFLALALNIVRELYREDWRPSEVLFAHRKPVDIAPYRRLFRVPLRFDAEQYALVFPADTLRRRVVNANADVLRLLQPQVDAVDAAQRTELPEQVRRYLRTAVLTHQAQAEQVAALFSMHRRTMNRHLNSSGTTFHQLLEESRFEVARQLLDSSGLKVGQIAAALDYHDASAFTRAFRRWCGETPAAWRTARGN
jgi:AraC-like DNA-binding protein